MTYIDRLNCFWQFANVTPLSTGQKLLYLALLDINNGCRWVEWFTVPNTLLQFKTGLSRKAINDARGHLVQVGLISYKKGKSNQAGSYYIRNLECNILHTDYTASYPQTTHTLPTDYTQAIQQTTTLIDKDIDIDISSSINTCAPAKKIYKSYEENIGALTGIIAEELEGYMELLCPEAVEYAIRQAAINNKKSCSYVRGVCKHLVAEGIKTPLDLERHIKEREEQRQAAVHSAAVNTDDEKSRKLAEQKARWGDLYNA